MAPLRSVGLYLLAVSLLAGSSVANGQPAYAQSTKPSFNYTLGGSDWGGSCLNGTAQSPINIRQVGAVNGTLGANSSLGIEYSNALRNYTVTNRGQTIEFDAGVGNYVTLPISLYNPRSANGSTSLQLLQSHFHEPSEHFREGVAYPLEQHFVHNDTVTGQIAVFGVFYKIHDEEVENPYLNQVFKYAPLRFNNQTKVTNETMNLAAWPPVNGTGFYHYNGSLTTPPCSEKILWFLLDTPLTMSSSQLQMYQRLTVAGGGDRGGNRPLQRLGTRTLMHYT